MVHKFCTRVDNHLNQAFESEARSLSMSVAAQKKFGPNSASSRNTEKISGSQKCIFSEETLSLVFVRIREMFRNFMFYDRLG